MSIVDVDLAAMVDTLRQEGSDNTEIEVKGALGGYPRSLAESLSSFANRPGGGIILLGLSEDGGFSVEALTDPAGLAQSLVDQARKGLEPPLLPEVEVARFEGGQVVIARIPELAPSLKPCRIRATGKAYVRGYDGDHTISEQEEEVFRANRGQPVFDREPLEGSSAADLDRGLVTAFLTEVRNQSARLAALPDEEVLFLKGVLAEDRKRLTLAGAYALGSYPQRFIPTLSITASVAPGPHDPPEARSADIAYFDGPLPDLLENSLAWVRRNTATRIMFGTGRPGEPVPAYPDEALRELIANALVHRDVGPHARSAPVTLRLLHDRLVVANMGGLWGLTVEQLGRTPGGHARNPVLYEICKYVRTRSGLRVIEAIGSGVAAARAALARAGMTSPRFMDSGVRFTALVPRHTLLPGDDLDWLVLLENTDGLSDVQRHALVAMRHGKEWTNSSFRAEFATDSLEARRALTDLVSRGLAIAVGEDRGRTYRLATAAGGVSNEPSPARALRENKAHEDLVTAPVVPAGRLPGNQQTVLRALSAGATTVRDVSDSTGLSPRQVTYALSRLIQQGAVHRYGGQGNRSTAYTVVTRTQRSTPTPPNG